MADKDKKQLEQEKRVRYDEFFRDAWKHSWPHAGCAIDRTIYNDNKKIIDEIAKRYRFTNFDTLKLTKHQMNVVHFQQESNGMLCLTELPK